MIMRQKKTLGSSVYRWYRLDKNVSWFNVFGFIGGVVYGLVTLKIFKKSNKCLQPPKKLWLPPKWG